MYEEKESYVVRFLLTFGCLFYSPILHDLRVHVPRCNEARQKGKLAICCAVQVKAFSVHIRSNSEDCICFSKGFNSVPVY